MVCPNCKNQVYDNIKVCPFCGTNVEQLLNNQTVYNQPNNNIQSYNSVSNNINSSVQNYDNVNTNVNSNVQNYNSVNNDINSNMQNYNNVNNNMEQNNINQTYENINTNNQVPENNFASSFNSPEYNNQTENINSELNNNVINNNSNNKKKYILIIIIAIVLLIVIIFFVSKLMNGSDNQTASTIATCPGCKFIYTTTRYAIEGSPEAGEYSSDMPEGLTNDYTTLTGTGGHPYFLGLIESTTTPGKIGRAFACGIENGEVFCLEGYEDDKHADNVATLNTVFSGCGVSVSDNDALCYGVSLDGNAFSTGGVYVYLTYKSKQRGGCEVSNIGYLDCY